jgi:hypothetical protein
MMTETRSCPLCVAMTPRVPLVLFLRRTWPFCAIPCLCPGAPHLVLLQHPHTYEGCAGYPWQDRVRPALKDTPHA